MSATVSPSPAAPSPLSALGALAPVPPLPHDADAVEAEALESAQPDNDLLDQLKRWIAMPNIADDETIPDEVLSRIAMQVVRDYDLDENSRADWKTKYEKWLDFAMQVAEEKTYPWPQASNVIYPLLTNAAIQFAARAYPAIIRDRNVVKGTVIGNDTGEPMPGPDGKPVAGPDGQPIWLVQPGVKKDRADKIGQHMSWQLLDEQEEWEPQTDKLLIVVAIVGTMFRKSYFDPELQRNVSETVSALDLCVNYKARSFETAPRMTEIIRLYPWEIEENIRAGVFLDDDYGTDQDAGQDDDALVTFLEQHRRYDLDGDGYPEPYIITVAKDTNRLARIRAAYDEEGIFFTKKTREVLRIKQVAYYTKYGFVPSPDSGVYDMGFGHLLFPINEAINSSLNQLFDAGHLQNAGGGFIGSNLSMNTGAVRFQVGEYKPVNMSGGTIRDAVFPIPFPGPSQVLFELLQFLVEAGKEIAAIKDIMVGDMPGDNTSGITTLAVIEQGLKVFSAIYKRIHRSLKSEFKKLFRLNRLYLSLEAGYRTGDEWRSISRADYEQGAGVEPVSDPQMMTDMQRLGRAQFLGQFKDDPWFDGRAIRAMMLDAAQIPGSEALLVQQLPPNPELTAMTAKLSLQHEIESVRASHEEADIEIRRGKDKASEIEALTRAILNLANAQKADHASGQGWYALQLEHLRMRMEALNAGSASPADNPSSAAGLGQGGSLGAPGGNVPGPVPAMAPPSGQQTGAPVPGGLPGPGGA